MVMIVNNDNVYIFENGHICIFEQFYIGLWDSVGSVKHLNKIFQEGTQQLSNMYQVKQCLWSGFMWIEYFGFG